MKFLFLLLLIIAPIFAFAQDEGVIRTIPSPQYPYGLTHDGSNLWVGTSSSNSDQIVKIDTTNGAVVGSITVPFVPSGSYYVKGLAHDGQNLWVFMDLPSADHPDKFYKVDPATGVVLKTINSPTNNYIGGMTWVDNHIWFSSYYSSNATYNNTLVKMDTTGAYISHTVTPGEQPMGVAFDGQYIWCAEDTGYGATRQEIYKYDPFYTGEFIRCPDDSPRDMTWDGKNLWLIGYYSQSIYQISTSGGTPQINIPITDIYFAQTTVGDTGNFVLSVNNNGTAPLHIDSMVFNSSVFFVEEDQFPYEIAPGSSYNFNLRFVPAGHSFYSGIVQIHSDDPVDPLIQIDMSGQGVLSGPVISLTATSHNFGNVWISTDGTGFWRLGIINQGDQNLEISDLQFTSPEFSIDSYALPFYILPNDTASIRLIFHPTQQQTYYDTLSITSNDSVNLTVELNLEGAGFLGNYDYGYQFWNYFVPDNPNAGSYQELEVEAVQPINDINDDGIDDVIAATVNYWILCLDGSSSGIADTLWSFNLYLPNNVGSIGSNYEYGVQDAMYTKSDLNNDGYNDVVIGTGGSNEHVYALNGRNGEILWEFGDNINYGYGDFNAVEAKRDFSGDGVPDVLAIASGNQAGTGYKRAYLFNGTNGNIIWSYYYPGPYESFAKAIISLEDVSGDSIPDAAMSVSNNGSTDLKVYGLNGTTGLPIWNFESIAYGPKELLEYSVAGQTSDIIVAEYFGYIHRLDGETGSVVWTSQIGLNGMIQINLLSDINGDGFDEVLVASFANYLTCLSGADGTYLWTYPMTMQFGVSSVPDINGDGYDDVVTGDGNPSPTHGTVYCVSGLGDSLFFSQFYDGDKVRSVNILPSIDGNSSFELLAGTREGKIICFSGGLNSPNIIDTEKDKIIDNFVLSQNYPNPFNPTTEIKFRLPKSGLVNLTVYNLLGQEITKMLKNKYYSAGEYIVEFNANTLSSGVYFYKMQTQFDIQLHKMILLK
jgi:outer membrane protein assembly factor BamB